MYDSQSTSLRAQADLATLVALVIGAQAGADPASVEVVRAEEVVTSPPRRLQLVVTASLDVVEEAVEVSGHAVTAAEEVVAGVAIAEPLARTAVLRRRPLHLRLQLQRLVAIPRREMPTQRRSHDGEPV